MKQLPGKQEVLKADFLEMRVEATGFKILGLGGLFPCSERVYFKPLLLNHFVLKSSSFLAFYLQALRIHKIRSTSLRYMFISPLYSVSIHSEGLY